MYFSFFKPQDWRKRSVVRGREFIQRFPNKDVSRYYGMREAKVKSMLYRIRQGLKEYLEKEGYSL